MTLSLFKTLIAIADNGNFAKAAQQVCVTQAAVGQQMRRLEDQFGVILFDRSDKSPKLNHLGHALVPKAREIVRSYETVFDDLIGEAQFSGDLSLGAIPSSIRGLVPISIKGLRETCPDLHIRVLPDLSEELQDNIERGLLDAAILSEPKRMVPELSWTPIATEELVLITSPKLQGNNALKILDDHPFIRHTNRSPVGWLAEEWLNTNKVVVRNTMEMGTLDNVTSMVAHNLGVSIVPNVCVPDQAFSGLRKIPLPGASVVRNIGIITRTDCSKLRLVERLTEQLRITVLTHGIDAI